MAVGRCEMSGSLDVRFDAYIEKLSQVLGRAQRRGALQAYATGLLSDLERKSMEPIAALSNPLDVRAAHQSLHHFVANADWSDAALLTAVR